MPDDKIRIFVSYKIEQDENIADYLEGRLRLIGGEKIEVYVCHNTPGGDDYHNWIGEHIGKADILLLLVTRVDVQLRWLTYEIGLFQGRQGNKGRVICIKSQHVDQMPQIQNLQAYDATVDGVSNFLIDLFHDGTITPNKEILKPDLLSSFQSDVSEIAERMATLFHHASVKVSYFPNRLEIGPLVEFDENNVETRNIPLLEAQVQFEGETRRLFGLAEQRSYSWKDVSSLYPLEEDSWVVQVEQIVSQLRDPGVKRSPRRLLTTFESSNQRFCYPLVSRIERTPDVPLTVSILFAELEPSEKPGELAEGLTNAPANYREMVGLLNITRRARWNVINPALAYFDDAAFSDQDAATKFEAFMDRLRRIEKEANENNWLNSEIVAACFPEAWHNQIQELFRQYGDLRRQLDELKDPTAKSEVCDLLKVFREINKRFFLLALLRYQELIDRLDPKVVRFEEYRDLLGDGAS